MDIGWKYHLSVHNLPGLYVGSKHVGSTRQRRWSRSLSTNNPITSSLSTTRTSGLWRIKHLPQEINFNQINWMNVTATTAFKRNFTEMCPLQPTVLFQYWLQSVKQTSVFVMDPALYRSELFVLCMPRVIPIQLQTPANSSLCLKN